MAIESISGNVINTASQAKTTAKSSADVKDKIANNISDDTVSLTATAQDIKSAVEAGLSAPVVNETRVAEIKAALQSGSYQISPERLAEKMLQFERKLPNST